MAAFIWNANPRMWTVVPPHSDGWDALRAYVTDPSGYVYWSTPKLQADIRVGDFACIWRTTHKKGNTGIVAVGRVEESPRQLTPSSIVLFQSGARLRAAGWDEQTARSTWKTGIRIEKTFWSNPVNVGMSGLQGTVNRILEENLRAITRAIPDE